MNKRIEKLEELADLIHSVFHLNNDPQEFIRRYDIQTQYGIFENDLLGQINKILLSCVMAKSLTSFAEAMYLIEVCLKEISIRLFKLFNKDQKDVRVNFKRCLGEDAKEGSFPREYLIHYLQEKRGAIDSEIELLKEKFNSIISLAKELHFPVLDDEQYRYDWYRVLSLSPSEIYMDLHYLGVPKEFEISFD